MPGAHLRFLGTRTSLRLVLGGPPVPVAVGRVRDTPGMAGGRQQFFLVRNVGGLLPAAGGDLNAAVMGGWLGFWPRSRRCLPVCPARLAVSRVKSECVPPDRDSAGD